MSGVQASSAVSRTGRLAALPISLAIAGVVLVYHVVPVINHFEKGGFILDTGWFAHLLQSADPLLRNPAAVNDLSFYSYHFSPILYLWSILVTRPLGLTGIHSFALFHGVAYAVPAFLLAWQTEKGLHSGLVRWLFRSLILAFFLLGEFVLRETGYPHYEAAVTGLTLFTFLALRDRSATRIAAGFILLALYREDGGFYAAYATVCVSAIAAIDGKDVAWGRGAALAGLGIAISVTAILIQKHYFPGFDSVRSNFVGSGFFAHLTPAFIVERLAGIALSAGLLPLLLGLALLGWFHKPYLVPLLCLLPLLGLHALSVRDELGLFTLHYGLPFAVIQLLVMAQAIGRGAAGRAGAAELAALAFFILSTTAPVSALLGLRNSGYYTLPVLVFDMPDGVTAQYLDEIDGALRSGDAKVCASVGVVALRPDAFPRDTHLNGGAVPDGCGTAIVFDGDMDSHAAKKALADAGYLETRRVGRLLFFQPGAN